MNTKQLRTKLKIYLGSRKTHSFLASCLSKYSEILRKPDDRDRWRDWLHVGLKRNQMRSALFYFLFYELPKPGQVFQSHFFLSLLIFLPGFRPGTPFS